MTNGSTSTEIGEFQGLRQIPVDRWHRTDHGDFVADFYRPLLSNSIHYDRTSGYFDTASLQLVMASLAQFTENGERIRLVISPRTRRRDLDALLSRCVKPPMDLSEAFGSNNFIDVFVECMTCDRFAATRRLIERKALDVRIAYVDDSSPFSYYHEKLGIFSDQFGNRVAFTSSVNETGLGWNGHFESFDVYTSWRFADVIRFEQRRQALQVIWTDNVDGLCVVPLEEARDQGIGINHVLINGSFTQHHKSLRHLTNRFT